MSKAKKCVPPLRFRAETLPHAECGPMRDAKPWETKPLNEWLAVSNAENRGGMFSAEEVLSVSGEYGVVNQIDFQGRSFAGASLAHYRVLKKGQVVYTKSPLKRAPFGIVKANQFQDGIVSALYGVYDVKDAEPAFVQRYFDAIDRLNNYLCPLVNKGAKNTLLISDEDALAGMVCFPSPPEQRKIGGFFCSLDALIEARAKALEKVESLKKSMLQKMFPQDDSLVPEVRFKGFGEEWQKNQLSDIVVFSKGKGYSKSDIRESGIPLFLYGRMYTDYRFVVDEINTYALLKEDSVLSKGCEVVLPASGETPEDIARASAIVRKGVILGGDLNVLVPKDCREVASPFLALGLSCGRTARKIAYRAQGKTVAHLHNSDLADLEVLLPSVSEQHKIDSYFRSLDALIAARREEVGKLKQMKKALLERMFV